MSETKCGVCGSPSRAWRMPIYRGMSSKGTPCQNHWHDEKDAPFVEANPTIAIEKDQTKEEPTEEEPTSDTHENF